MRAAALQSLPAFTDVVTAPPLGPLRLSHLVVKVTSITQVDATAHALGTLLQAHRVTVLGVSFPESITAQLRQLDGMVIPVDFVVDPLAFLVMLAALLLIVTLASVVPARRASRLRIVNLLRYE